MNRMASRSRGGALLEILIVLLAILVLSAGAVVAYSGRADESRLAQATEGVKALADAETAAARAHGVYVPLQALDDLAQDPARRTPRTDDIANEPDSIHAISSKLTAQSKPGEAGAPVKSLTGWKGPFASFRRAYLGSAQGRALTTVPDTVTAQTMRRGYPLDPWGTPYRFYSPVGIIGTDAAKDSFEALDSDTFSDGAVTGDDDRFDAYAIVSYGPDGKSDSFSNGNDDIIIYLSAPDGAK